MPRKHKRPSSISCPACGGNGRVCCHTWALVRVEACGDDLEFNELGLPLWPLSHELEMPHCPFCRGTFNPKGTRNG